MPKNLVEFNESLKGMTDAEDKVDVSTETAKKSAAQLKRDMMAAEHRSRVRNGEPVGSLSEYIATRDHSGKK